MSEANEMQTDKKCCAFSEAWHVVRGSKRAILISFLVLVVASVTVQYALKLAGLNFSHEMSSVSAIANIMVTAKFAALLLIYFLIDMFFLMPMRMGLLLTIIRNVSNKPTSVYLHKFFRWHYIWRMAVLSALIGLLVGIPIAAGSIMYALVHALQLMGTLAYLCYVATVVLFLIALYLIVSYLFAPFLIVDQDMNPWDALVLSRRKVDDKWFSIFFVIIWGTIVCTVGFMLLFVGLVWAIPYTANLYGLFYRNLFGVAGRDPVTLSGK